MLLVSFIVKVLFMERLLPCSSIPRQSPFTVDSARLNNLSAGSGTSLHSSLSARFPANSSMLGFRFRSGFMYIVGIKAGNPGRSTDESMATVPSSLVWQIHSTITAHLLASRHCKSMQDLLTLYRFSSTCHQDNPKLTFTCDREVPWRAGHDIMHHRLLMSLTTTYNNHQLPCSCHDHLRP